jgi:hypothetical protein
MCLETNLPFDKPDTSLWDSINRRYYPQLVIGFLVWFLNSADNQSQTPENRLVIIPGRSSPQNRLLGQFSLRKRRTAQVARGHHALGA